MTLNQRVLLTCLSLLVISCSKQESPPEKPQNEGVIAVAPNTDLSQLQTVTPIAGQPRQVWWNRTAMGKQTTNTVPGPTDTHLEAWLDFGSAEAVAELVADKQSSRAVKLVPAAWIPELFNTMINVDGRVEAKQYKDVPGFHPDARISVPTSMPSYIILHHVQG